MSLFDVIALENLHADNEASGAQVGVKQFSDKQVDTLYEIVNAPWMTGVGAPAS